MVEVHARKLGNLQLEMRDFAGAYVERLFPRLEGAE